MRFESMCNSYASNSAKWKVQQRSICSKSKNGGTNKTVEHAIATL